MAGTLAKAREAVTTPARPPVRTSSFGFGMGPRVVRRRIPTSGQKSDAELIADYLRHNEVKKGPPRFADGALRESGTYVF